MTSCFWLLSAFCFFRIVISIALQCLEPCVRLVHMARENTVWKLQVGYVQMKLASTMYRSERVRTRGRTWKRLEKLRWQSWVTLWRPGMKMDTGSWRWSTGSMSAPWEMQLCCSERPSCRSRASSSWRVFFTSCTGRGRSWPWLQCFWSVPPPMGFDAGAHWIVPGQESFWLTSERKCMISMTKFAAMKDGLCCYGATRNIEAAIFHTQPWILWCEKEADSIGTT